MDKSAKNILIICITVVICAVLGITALLIIRMNGNGRRDEAVVSVFLSINPVIRIDLNARGNIIGVIPQNTAGEAVAAGFSARNMNLAEAVNALTDKAHNLGLVSEGGAITLSIYAPDESHFAEASAALHEAGESIAGRHPVTVTLNRVDEPIVASPPATPRP